MRQELVGASEFLCGQHGVGSSQGFGLQRERDVDAGGSHAGVVLAHQVVFGADHQARVLEFRVGERAEHIIEERTAERESWP